MAQNHALSYVSCFSGSKIVKALEKRVRTLVLCLSELQIFPEKINNMLSLNSLGFIDVNQTLVI